MEVGGWALEVGGWALELVPGRLGAVWIGHSVLLAPVPWPPTPPSLPETNLQSPTSNLHSPFSIRCRHVRSCDGGSDPARRRRPPLRSGSRRPAEARSRGRALGRRHAEEDVADEKVGQLLVPRSVGLHEHRLTQFETLATAVHHRRLPRLRRHRGGPRRLLDAHYGSVTLGQPLAAASSSTACRRSCCIRCSTPPTETGAGFRLAGATTFPRNMAFAPLAGASRLRGRPHHRARVARHRRRSAWPRRRRQQQPAQPGDQHAVVGEDPALVGTLGGAYVRGLGRGMIATLNFGTRHRRRLHLGLPIIKDARVARSDRFRRSRRASPRAPAP